jgi:hypothetical protein
MRLLSRSGVLLLFLFLILQACTLKEAPVQEFVIADAETGRVLDTYEYDTGTSQLVRVITYGENQKANKTIEFSYDPDGNLSRAVIQRRGFQAVETDIVDYAVKEEYDEKNRLVKTTAWGDNGEEIETYYQYNDQGTVHKVTQTAQDGSVMMKEYN